MNEYKITYTMGSQTYTTQRVERTEASVRKAFCKAHKDAEIPVEITGIEFLRDDACATKQQERDTLAALRERVLTPDDLTDAIQLVTEKRLALDAEVKNAAERIVEAAAEPESAAFQNAVKDHRAAKSSLDYYTALLERLVKAQGE